MKPGIRPAGGMELLAEQGLDWLNTYTFTVVFIGVLIDASGLPFPGRLLLVAAGALTRWDYSDLAWVIALAAAAAMLMDLAWYVLARWGGDRVIALYRKLPGWRGRRRRGDPSAADYFARYGAATIPLGRFFATVRAFAWPMAATRGVGYAQFLALDLVAAVAWAALWVLLGASVGAGWRAAAESAGTWMLLAGGLIVAGAAAVAALLFWRRRASAGVPTGSIRR